MSRRVLVTGGAGFIGSAFIRYGMKHIPELEKILNFDLLTYAGNLDNLQEIEEDPRYVFAQGDINDEALVEKLCREHNIDTVVHFAAESHVDKSIVGPKVFVETNVRGTLSLLEVVRRLPHLHFHHVSTDEVYGSLGMTGCFSETSPYAPNSPYAASKAASDHFVRAYAHTYDLSTTLSHCTNNYGPCQHGEKLIPLMISRCLQRQPMPVYGTGLQIRDWLYVDDHARALWQILKHKTRGAIFDIGGSCEKSNLEVIDAVIDAVAEHTDEDPEFYRGLVAFVADRPGHDFRYAIDTSKIKHALGWEPKISFEEGLRKTVAWFLTKNQVKSASYDWK